MQSIRSRNWRAPAILLAGLAAALMVYSPFAETEDSKVKPPGDEKSAKTRALELGAKAMQRSSPLDPMDVYLVGFHPMKEEPAHQMEAHHYCHQVNEDFAQCVLFDGNSASANLNGVEYIISERIFESLPEEERRYWHPHNGEILSGQLVAPGIPDVAEKELMEQKMNSYGKTWHVWNTGAPGRQADRLPFGDPKLAWSFNRDGEADPKLIADRDRRLGIDTPAKREQRAQLRELAKPQEGVDALKGMFERPVQDIPGVIDKQAAAQSAAAQQAVKASSDAKAGTSSAAPTGANPGAGTGANPGANPGANTGASTGAGSPTAR